MEKRLDDNTESKLCEPCQGNVSRQAEADGFCNDCGEYMCQTCFQSHLKFKLGRNHVFEALDGGVRKVALKLETKCRKHDSVGCELCFLFDHPKCESGLIENQDMDQVRADLEKALERFWKTNSLEKEQRENLEKACTTLKKELEDHRSLLSRERELYINQKKELEQTIVRLNQDNSSLNDSNISLKRELDSRKKKFKTLKSDSEAMQEQDHTQIESLKSELKKISEGHANERKILCSRILSLRNQDKPRQKTNPLPDEDPGAVGFNIGDLVVSTKPDTEGQTGIVDDVYVEAKWNIGRSSRYNARNVKLLAKGSE